LGRRIAKSVNNVVTWYVYDGNAILAAYDLSGTVTARYAHGLNIDEPLAVQQGSVTSFYHADGLGSIVALTNAAGSVVQTYSYDSFGNITQSGGINQPYTYTAREYDSETGLYFYRARYYDPKAGRFITKDPISFAGGDVNLYAYVGNNSINWIDPYGLNALTDVMPFVVTLPALDGPLPVGDIIAGTALVGAGLYDLWQLYREKYQKPENPNKRKGADDRKKCGERERNVGHPDSEEHSRVPKGPKGPYRR
jgi:RHS repeat-associated protein